MTAKTLKLTALLAVAVFSGAACTTAGESMPQERVDPAEAPAQIDHLILAINDLPAGMARFEKLTGVKPVGGGRHPHLGTHNALIALGPQLYLEILAPHPEMALIDALGWLRDVDDLEPMGWAASTTDMKGLIETLHSHGYETSEGSPGSRARPDGATLSWTTMGLTAPDIPGAPFFIEWGPTSMHPATTSPAGCTLDALGLTVSDPKRLSRLLDLLQLDVAVKPGGESRTSITIALSCPDGPVTFKGFTRALSAGD